jgi:hypothetical protein
VKERILLISGCSHAAGSEIDGTHDSASNRQKSFGNILARKLDRKPVNIASGGMSNQGIARGVYSWMNRVYDPDTMDVMVLCAWTDSLRIEIPWSQKPTNYHLFDFADWLCMAHNQYLRMNLAFTSTDKDAEHVTKFYHQYIAENKESLEINSANIVLQMQWFLKHLNIEYVMCNTMKMFHRTVALNFYLQMIDTSKYYHAFNNAQSFWWKYKNEGYTNDLATYWHHGEEPHKLFADELLALYLRNQDEKPTT